MKTPRPILERRRSVRLEENLPFKIGHEGYALEARTLNISAHGAMCVVDKDIPVMTKLEIGICLPALHPSRPNEVTLHAKGVVVRKAEDPAAERFYIGVYFSDIGAKDLKILQEYIDHRLKSR